MELKPPIQERATEDLLDIIETSEQWREDVVESAKMELVARGVPVEIQQTRRTIRVKFNERIKRTKERATYTTLEKILIVLFGPILVVVFRDLFLFDSGEGYKRKNRQGWFYLLLGVGLWGLMLFVFSRVS